MIMIISTIIAMALMGIILMNWGNKEKKNYLQRIEKDFFGFFSVFNIFYFLLMRN
jgi:NhaP-type Na+/H+ or K+/H+ antiporter